MSVFKNMATREPDYEINNNVEKELNAANIPILRLPGFMTTEVKTRYVGYLNGFLFWRAWRYWVCEGLMPMANANEIYEQISIYAVRAGGSAANPEPSSVATNPAYAERIRAAMEIAERAGGDVKERIRYVEANVHPLPSDELFVSSYHIDTEEGLEKLVDYIRSHDVHAAAN